MSEELAAEPQPTSDGWGQPITKKRQAELDAVARQQRLWADEPAQERGESPFNGVHLTGADIFWLSARALAGSMGSQRDLAAAAERLRDTGRYYDLDLTALHVERAFLRMAHLEHAALILAHLEGANLIAVHMEEAHLRSAHLEGADLYEAHLEHASLVGTHLEGTTLNWAYFDGADLRMASLEGASLHSAHLEGADLREAHLERANLFRANLKGADLREAHLEGADLREAYLEGVDLRGAWFDSKTVLNNAMIADTTRLGDIQWSGVGSVNLTQISWADVPRLGDERDVGLRSPVDKHEAVVRAYRQVATQLRAQGIAEVADRFAYRAQVCQRWGYLRSLVEDWHRPWRLPGDVGRYLGSAVLALLAGYGYRPGRTIFWYLVTIAGFAAMFLAATHGWVPFGLPAPSQLEPLPWYEALILSVSSFHGRGFFQPLESLGDPVAALAAIEAVVGLLIEISFIATFTQRFFGAK